jgi:site-specific recombinase XerD
MLLENAIGEFKADLMLMGRAARTIEGHELELLRLQRWCIAEGLDWQLLTRRQIQPYARLRAELGHSSRANMFCTLRTFYAWSVEVGHVAMSPAAGFKTPTRPHPLPRALTLLQVRQLVGHLRENAGAGLRQSRDEALLLTALYAGLRACELAPLCWSNIDVAGGVINIRLTKMNKGRSVPIHPALREVLDRWRTIQQLDSSAPAFSLDQVAIEPNRVGKVARRYAIALSIPLTAHVLRHTFATWMLRRSGNLYAVSKSLGHSQVRQTEIYVSADVEDLRSALEQLPGVDGW